MARKPRVQLPHLVRHVMSRGNGRMEIFLDDTDYRQFTYQLADVVEEFDIECWNYCLMPNHYHATLRPRRPNISAAMKKLNGDYAQWWNKRHGRVGHVFQGRFKSPIVQNDVYLLQLSRYVALNPVRAGLVNIAQDWPWASYPAVAGLAAAPPFIAVSSTLRMFGEIGEVDLEERFAAFVNQAPVAGPLDDRFRSNELIIGDGEFKARVKAEIKALCADQTAARAVSAERPGDDSSELPEAPDPGLTLV